MKRLIKVLGNSLLLSMFILMIDAFRTAWFSPSKSARIFINSYNEMYFDLICLGIILIFGVWSLILNIIDWIKE